MKAAMERKDHLPNVKETNVFWSFFSSLKLAIALLFFIVLLSIAGSIIPQQEASLEFIRRLPPGWAAVLQKMQFLDLYHSIWFFLLLGLLSLNLVICSLNRFPVTWKSFRAKAFPDTFTSLENLPASAILMTEERHERALQRMEALLARKYRKAEKKETSQGTFLHAERGRFSLFGVYIIHLSILIIIAGAVVGSIVGFNGFVKVAEGESVDTIHLKGNGGEKKLNFSIRCDRFSVNYYEDGLPMEYRSDLTFLKNDSIAYHGSLLVNHPITFEGIRFYQASYGTMSGGKITLTFRKSGGKKQRVTISSGDAFELPEGRAQIRLLRVEENLMQMGPAVKLNVRSSNRDIQFWVFKEIEEIKKINPGILTYVPLLNPGLFKPYIFSLDHMDRKYYTGLQVTYDPGIPIVAAGAFLLFAGFMVVFFISHRQIMIGVDTDGDHTRIRLVGKTNRDPRRMQRELEHLMDSYKNSGVGA
jgi:cytochrome c biogenesis protein